MQAVKGILSLTLMYFSMLSYNILRNCGFGGKYLLHQ